MTFVGYAFLAALPLAAAPLLLHLFDRRRNVVIEWGAMQFLVEAASQKTSARKLKQWLLLLLRILAVVALILGLAQVSLIGSWLGQSERGETIFVLDNSMSMQRLVDGKSLFDAARQHVDQLVESGKSGDAIRVFLASPYPVWAFGRNLSTDQQSRVAIVDELNELQATDGRSDLLSALFTAAQAELPHGIQHRRIVLLTDRQRSDWSLDDQPGWDRLQEVLQASLIPTVVEIVDPAPGARDINNVAVTSIHSSRTVVGIGQTFTMTAMVQNFGQATSAPSTMKWIVGDEPQAESQIPELESATSHEVLWKHAFRETGVFAVKCELSHEDELRADNRATVVVEVVEEVPVLVVENSPELAELQQDAFFVAAALGWVDSAEADRHSVFVPRLVTSSELERLELSQYRAVVVPNLTSLNEEVIRRLQDYVTGGGGLWLATGPRTDLEAFNQHFFADGSGLSPLALDRIIDDTGTAPDQDGVVRHATLDVSGIEHPAVTELADAERLDTADVIVEQRFRFVPPPEGEQVSILMALSNTEPLVVEKYAGRGRVIVQAIPLRLQWSQLARSQAFVVMVHDWLAYLTQPRATRHNLNPGDPIAVHVPASETRDATLQTPQGDAIELTADVMGDGHLFRTSRTILPGDYVLELGAAGDRIPFHVNRDPTESNLAALTTAELQQIADAAAAGSTVESSGTVMSADQAPLWPMLFAALIALIAGELVLSGMIARERFGSDPIAETTDRAGSMPFASNGPASQVRPIANAASTSQPNEYATAERK